MSEMEGRTAVVTGASSGLGRATAALLARRGADVVLMALDDEHLGSAYDEVAAHGTRVRAVPVDVGDAEAVRAAFAEAESVGEVDAVFNNAGISRVVPVQETTDDTWAQLARTNLAGSFHVAREAARTMSRRRRGAIVNSSSELALVGESGYVAYSTTKGGMLAMARTLAAELAPVGIRVNAVCPGAIDTPLFQQEIAGSGDREAELDAINRSIALGRVGLSSEVAEAVVFLLSDRASYITGTELVVDGGRSSCVPTTHDVMTASR